MPANLQEITTKIRRLTRSPSEQMISDAQIQDYVNTFILYDFPEILRLFEFRTTLTWYCLPFIDTYTTDNNALVPELVNFDNLYITTHYPIYSAGNRMVFTQKPEEFYNLWPLSNSILQVGSGNGVNTFFAGNLTNFGGVPVLRNEVTFSSVDSNNNGLAVFDDGAGNLIGNVGAGPNTVNYVTGAFQFNYSVAPGAGTAVNVMTFPYQPSRPTSILYYDDKFTLRPVPDQPYPINIEVYIRPTALLQAGDVPKLEQHWQFIAYGSAIKILQDRTDFDTVNLHLPEFERQKLLVQRRSWDQYSNEQVGTIYTNQLLDRNQFGSGNFNFYW